MSQQRAIIKRLIQVALFLLFFALCLFLSAGRLDWIWGWAFIAVYVGMIAANAVWMDRELIAERAEVRAGTKDWDAVLSSVSMLLVTPGALIVAGLDVRFGWSQPAPAIQWVALAGVVLGYGLVVWAMAANRFFALTVRIQKERGHIVISSGPYGLVRHPGYLGFVLSALGLPLMLGSLWALIPSGLGVVGIVLRTALEDRTLHQELPGYGEYAKKVRFRLLPGVW